MRPARLLLATAASVTLLLTVSGAQTYKILYTFAGAPDGAHPSQALYVDTAGTIYGATGLGGPYTGGSCSFGSYSGCGVVFKLDTAGQESVLYSFSGGTDGNYPSGSVLSDGAGNLIGITEEGGALNCDPSLGCGTVFKVNTQGSEKVLVKFRGRNGQHPVGGLVRDAGGNFYSVTQDAGPNFAFGTVFKLAASGGQTLQHAFRGAPDDGYSPEGALVRDAQGNLYGTTFMGGSHNVGAVFEISNDGTESILYSFKGDTDAIFPQDGVFRDTAGNLYGTTFEGGAFNLGAVYKITGSTETILHSFTGGSDGSVPRATVVGDSAGNLYGVAREGGDPLCNCGTVYEITAGGEFVVLHTFTGADGDGATPLGGLALRDGTLYGTGFTGGDLACDAPDGCGVVFSLKP